MKNIVIVLKNKWKHKFIKSFFSDGDNITIVTGSERLEYNQGIDYFFWASDIYNDFYIKNGNKDNVFLIEDGFFRSVGLGADHRRPLSLVFDKNGIYYDSNQPSDLENLLNIRILDDKEYSYSKLLINNLLELKVNKYNLASKEKIFFNTSLKKILVVGQVETDQSIIRGSQKFKTNAQLLQYIKNEHPEAYIIYKPHPDTLVGGRQGYVKNEKLYDKIILNASILDLFDHVDEVHTITSLAGFEALLRGLPVFVYGMPFYAGWGLTNDYYRCERRVKKVDLYTLVYCALVDYPKYIDLEGSPCSVEKVIEILSSKEDKLNASILALRFKRNILKAMGFKF
ncbi:capsular polysaccharide export protein, LipB/KpsS family [Neptunomonas phycophila]|uniref:capsular polysaccharide export protein, LipB/KpsS family n=1 Tax=Neptunomonas phycophila TaxID=1572645 RepID=UPI00373613AF